MFITNTPLLLLLGPVEKHIKQPCLEGYSFFSIISLSSKNMWIHKRIPQIILGDIVNKNSLDKSTAKIFVNAL